MRRQPHLVVRPRRHEHHAAVPGALFFDPMPELCNATACTPWLPGGAMAYWDYDHLTLEGALHVAPALAAFLRAAGVLDAAAACPGEPQGAS